MNFDIIGIGSALVDITVRVEDLFLESENLEKGGMLLIDAQRLRTLLDKFPQEQKSLSPGGAAANVLAAFAHCGGNPSFIGKIGNDQMGKYFEIETEKTG